jgi:hypothetical protein
MTFCRQLANWPFFLTSSRKNMESVGAKVGLRSLSVKKSQWKAKLCAAV